MKKLVQLFAAAVVASGPVVAAPTQTYLEAYWPPKGGEVRTVTLSVKVDKNKGWCYNIDRSGLYVRVAQEKKDFTLEPVQQFCIERRK